MATHMSIRLAWHNDGWNGHVCKKPCENSYCVGRHSYPGELIAESRDLEYESIHAGEAGSSLMKPLPCALSANAFGSESLKARVEVPDFWGKNAASPAIVDIPPYTCCTWCYEKMYSDDVAAQENSNRQYDYDKRREEAESYFAQFEENKSLVFYCSGYSNPFSENEESNYVVVGVSRIKRIEPMVYYENTSENIRKRYGGAFVWQRPVTSNYPNEGFCIPYWRYKDNEEILNRIVIKPNNKAPFRYGSREVSNDDAIEVINQLLAVVDYLIDIKDDTEDWEERKKWLNSVLNELWIARGPFPGFASVLEVLNLNKLVSAYISVTDDRDMKAFRSQVLEFLNAEREDVCGITFSDAEKRIIRREYKLLDDTVVDLLMNILCRFDLTANQVKAIICDDRGAFSITDTIDQLIENPYDIFEQYKSDEFEDSIPLYKIDNGIISSPNFGLEQIFDVGATERFRAFCVDELRRVPAHSFVKAADILLNVNSRISRMPEWKQYLFKMKNFDVDTDVLDKSITQVLDKSNTKYLYLSDVYEDERLVESVLKDLANRPVIPLKMSISDDGFKEVLTENSSSLSRTAPDEYNHIINNQAHMCSRLFNKPFFVLSGAAGTGKTTIIKTIIKTIRRVHGVGTSFLLMAPTGKASERIKAQTEEDAMTIHSFLAQNGWINDNFSLRRNGGRTNQDVNTIIIDECSMIDLNLFATLFRAINWNSVQRLILVGDPNQLPPIGRGRVFADIIEWLNEYHPDCMGRLTDNVRQLRNRVDNKGCGILDLASIYIQEDQKSNDQTLVDKLKKQKESIFSRILSEGNGDVDKDLGVYFWNDQDDLNSIILNVLGKDMKSICSLQGFTNFETLESLWFRTIKDRENNSDPEIIQVLSPYCGEFYGTSALNQLLQQNLNASRKLRLDGISYFDKVIQIKNRPKSDLAFAYDENLRTVVRKDVYNGEIGVSLLHPFDKEKYQSMTQIERIRVLFSGKNKQKLKYLYGKDLGSDSSGRVIPNQSIEENLDLAYAITVHKSQGSEFDYVYIVIPKRNSHLMNMELLYTALTRAQKKVTLFLQDDISTLTTLTRIEQSAVRKINSSIFKFDPLPEELFNESSGWFESKKRISTLSEYLVRSKSEAIITNMLVERDIPFKYEEPLYADDGTMFLPDFTVTFRGETYYWEHVGLTNNKKYMEHWRYKEQWYNKHFPGRLIATYESDNLSKDAETVINKHA